MKYLLLVFLLPIRLAAQPFTPKEVTHWKEQSRHVTIMRDNWDIPHIYGKTDADAVFGLLYAQCEDDFPRVEMNYIEKLGRMAEIKGRRAVYGDLLIRLVIDSADAIADFKKCPAWLQQLMYAYADGINFYLYSHPAVKPALLTRFQPWYPLLWTDGSIGAISTAGVTEKELENFYTGQPEIARSAIPDPDPTGSNGFAFAPSITATNNAILYLNPHVSFYFRPEVHMVSEEGLNAYGAVTWGQFFIYQGFNEHCGWMHTSNNVDIADLYAEKISHKDNRFFYRYDNRQLPVLEKKIPIRYHAGNKLEEMTFNALFTGHGPIMAKRNGNWLSVKANNRSVNGLIQSWERTKTTSFAGYKKVMGLLANTSNNTVYADAEGNIAYWHGNFIPKRDTAYNWARPVDGSTSATEWKGLHTVEESVHLYNPPNGWLQNCNSTPFTVAGVNSPKRADYPAYMAPDGENFRGINAVRVLGSKTNLSLNDVIAEGYDTYLAGFEQLVPALVKFFDEAAGDTAYAALSAPIALLRNWDFRCGENSVATTLAVTWGEKLLPKMAADEDEYEFTDQVQRTKRFIGTAKPADMLQPFAATLKELQSRYGNWQIPWGQINRFQRITGNIELTYNDSLPSLPVGFAAALWGMLPSYASRYFPGTNNRYGVYGNSFICAVEFGKRIKAKSLLAGGESGHPAALHFADQALMYAKGQFKDVLFYREDVEKHAAQTYHPGNP